MSSTKRVRKLSALRGLACALLSATSVSLLADEAPLGGNLPDLIQYALTRSPALSASGFEVEAAQARVEPAGVLPDPRFQLELMDATNTMSGRGASLVPGEVGQTRYRVIQPIPFPGKRDLRAAVAEARVGQADAEQTGTRLAVETQVKTAFARHYQAAGQRQILEGTLSLLGALEPIVLTRYGVGLVPQQDAIRVQSEISALRVELLEVERREREAAARMNAALTRPADAPLAVPAALPASPDQLNLVQLRSHLREASPELARLRAGQRAAGHTRDLTYRERYPDMALALTNNRPRSGTDSWDVMLEVTIPFQQSARRAREREAERMQDAAEARVAAAEAALEGRIGEAWAGFEASRNKARLLRDTLLPQTEAAYAAAEAGYETGRVNFNTVIEAERQILRTRLALLDADVDRFVRVIELEQLTGAPL
ncbi:TolC family protein [Denitromonas ohlonensis]|uniref:TolC family protein n=2 Tax=Denitromonas TaxID=139331 RepID=A0A557R466_9RHOO|nr:TolC family protein [Denitromonas ohlonensis]TVO59965.1 TolC family protein [Denitromonas ohlonensis]TVO75069.1 TolC family protein [Denitromonas ohlonensis]